MALIKPSGTISDIRGKIGGTVFSNSSAGLVMKTKTSPVNRNTPKQNIQRSIINDLQQQWISLTDEQRECWVLYTKLFPMKQNNINGNLINAQQTFIKVNAPFRLYSLAIITDPVLTPSILIHTDSLIGQVLGVITLFLQRFMAPADEFLVLSMTYPKPPTINNPGTTYKSIIFTTTAAFSFDITNAYIAVFGRVPSPGENVFWKIHIVDRIIGSTMSQDSGMILFA